MDPTRRDFFKNLGAKGAGITASVVAPAITYTQQFSEEIEKVSSRLNEQIKDATNEIHDQVRGVSERVDASALMMGYQQTQINLIFLLLLLSFAVDGGIVLSWLV